jgi:translocation and assembly module TamA
MTRWRGCLALLAALASGCASLPGAEAPRTPTPVTTPSPQGPPAVQVEIQAPAELKALLERYLDLVRLGRLVARDDVDDTEWSRLIDATPPQVRSLLQTAGYFSPVIQMERLPATAAGQPDRVRVLVEPGQRLRVGRVSIEAEGELERGAVNGDAHAVATLEQIRKAWSLPTGREFRNADWGEAKDAVLVRLRAAGYATAAFSGTAAEVDLASQEVRIFVAVDSGPLFRFGKLRIEGLATHDEHTVGYFVGARRGAPVTEALLLDFQDRLQKSGLFAGISVTLDTDPQQAAEAAVVARLQEAPLQVYTLGLGFSANTRERASVEHLYRRVFGFAAQSRLKIELGRLRQAWDAELSSHPGERLYRNLIGGAVERLLSDTDEVLSQRLRIGRAQDTTRLERLFFAELERSLRRTNDGTRNSATAGSLNFHGGWRDLDNIVLPSEGETLSIQLGIGRSRGTDADTGNFVRAYGRLTVYRPLGRTWYGLARVELGRVFLGSNMVVPESHKWRAGGDDSVRGYAYRTLGPQVAGSVGSGTSLATGSLELARPVSAQMPSVWGAVFIDAGNAADSFGQLKPELGYGVGVRWRSPVGPLRLDLARAQKTGKARLHFSVGIAF